MEKESGRITEVKKVMVLCTGNSCRSQMAEGFLRQMGKGRIEVRSAGLIAAGVHPRAIAVMKEAGIDISGQESNTIDHGLLRSMALVITVCDNAEAACPATPPSVRRMHIPVKDPVGTTGSEEEIMAEFRRAREEIRRAMARVIREEVGG